MNVSVLLDSCNQSLKFKPTDTAIWCLWKHTVYNPQRFSLQSTHKWKLPMVESTFTQALCNSTILKLLYITWVFFLPCHFLFRFKIQTYRILMMMCYHRLIWDKTLSRYPSIYQTIKISSTFTSHHMNVTFLEKLLTDVQVPSSGEQLCSQVNWKNKTGQILL